VRLAWFKDLGGVPFDARVRAVVDGHQKTFESLGCVVEQAEPDFAPAEIAFRTLRALASANAYGAQLRDHPDAFKDTLKGETEEGLRLTGMDVARGESAHSQLWRGFQAFLEKYEYFVLPTTQLPPFDIDTPYPTEIAGVKFTSYIDWMKSCWYISATGNPAASVPGGFTPEGLPVGVQIVGRNKEDFSVLQMAHAFEQVTSFGKKRPIIA
jgi:amidase